MNKNKNDTHKDPEQHPRTHRFIGRQNREGFNIWLCLLAVGRGGVCDTLVAVFGASARLVCDAEPVRLGVRYACGVPIRTYM